MKFLVWVALGGALGASARHLLNVGLMRALGPAFPWSTLCANVVGCMLMGALAEFFVTRYGGLPGLRAFLLTGVLGGFTTFSAFAIDVANLWERREPLLAAVYLGASVGLSLAGVFLGLALARSILH
jgi:CrcB protein